MFKTDACSDLKWLEEHKMFYCIYQLAVWRTMNKKSGKEWLDRGGSVSLSADYSNKERFNRNSRSTASLRGNLHFGGEHQPKGQIQGGVGVPWIMRWACLPSDDELDGVPAALAVLHQDRHRILPTRQGAGQRLARSFHCTHSFLRTRP